MLGHTGNLQFTCAEGLKMKMPADRRCDYACTLKIVGLKRSWLTCDRKRRNFRGLV
jgi:hypothetical protein